MGLIDNLQEAGDYFGIPEDQRGYFSRNTSEENDKEEKSNKDSDNKDIKEEVEIPIQPPPTPIINKTGFYIIGLSVLAVVVIYFISKQNKK